MPKWLNFKRALIFSALLFWGLSFGCGADIAEPASVSCNSEVFDEIAIVETVYDGDTIKLRDSRVVRFIGINTPEVEHKLRPAQPLAKEAKAALLELIPAGSIVGLNYDQSRHDHFKRTLAHVYTKSGRNLSAELIQQGLGFAIVVPPNTAQLDCYFAMETQARQEGYGIWSHPAYQAKAVNTLSDKDTGFQYIHGKVTRIGRGKKNIWLDMGKRLSVRIKRKHLQYFTNTPIADFKGRQISVRGWVTFYNDKLRINIGHPAMMEIAE